MSRVLYWTSGSPPCWRVQIALEEKGLKYESKLISLSKSGTPLLKSVLLTVTVCNDVIQCRAADFYTAEEHKSDEVLALNPRGQVSTVTRCLLLEWMSKVTISDSSFTDSLPTGAHLQRGRHHHQ